MIAIWPKFGFFRYTALRSLGSGGYSKVYEVFNPEKELYALKVVNLKGISEESKKDLLKEIEYLKLFKGSQITFQKYFLIRKVFFLYFQYGL